jgi:hypothetical protein
MSLPICKRCKRDVVRETFYCFSPDDILCLPCIHALGYEVDPESMYSSPRLRRIYYATRDLKADTVLHPEDITTEKPKGGEHGKASG